MALCLCRVHLLYYGRKENRETKGGEQEVGRSFRQARSWHQSSMLGHWGGFEHHALAEVRAASLVALLLQLYLC